MGSDSHRFWAGGMDQVLAGLRYIALFSHFEVPPPAVLIDVVESITRAGPHTRLGLVPQPRKRLWTYDPSTPATVHQLPDIVANGGSAAILEYVRRLRGPRRPLELHVSGNHLALDVDHGLGDGRFALELTAALFALARGQTTPWMIDNDTPLALPWALLRTFGRHPGRLQTVRKLAVGLRSMNAGAINAEPEPAEPCAASLAVSVATVEADAQAAVTEWSTVNARDSGAAAVWLYLVRRALSEAGLAMTDKVMVACDCRRYLPGRTVSKNFIFGTDVRLGVDEPLPVIGRRLRELTASGTPLAGMAAVSARSMLPFRSAPVQETSEKAAHLMYTDLGDITRVFDGPASGTGQRSLTALLDPAGPHSVTAFTARTGSVRSISISFDESVVERRVIDRATQCLRDPIGLLTVG